MHPASTATSLFVSTTTAAGGGATWLLSELWIHGPGWALLPPLLLSAASFAGAVISGLKAREEARAMRQRTEQSLRHIETMHEIEANARRVELEERRRRLNRENED